MPQILELGLDTFGDVTTGLDGAPKPHPAVIRDVVAEGVLADALGIDFFGVGEHHREDYAIAAPDMVLAAIAGRTRHIRLGSAVTVLSSDDPVRVFQRFSTLNALSDGRAEVILGRGSFVESFPLFGYDLDQYETLFDEKLGLFAALLTQDRVTWSGQTRAGLQDQAVFPTLDRPSFRAWVGVGGSPASVVRAARVDMGLMLAVIGGEHRRFAPHADLYRRACEQFGHAPRGIGVHSPGYVAETDAQARDDIWPDYSEHNRKIGAERGWPPMTRAAFDREADTGALCVGAPETVARKIAAAAKALGLTRFDLKYSLGRLPHDKLMRGIELYGRKVVPMVRDMLA